MLNRFVTLAALMALVSPAQVFAQPSDAESKAKALVIEGAALGDAGDWSGAIERFRAANAIFWKASRHCNIGLGYAELKRLPEANHHLRQCQSNSAKALPDWVADIDRDILKQLTNGRYATVRFHTPTPGATVSIPSVFPDDRLTAPVSVWLPEGEHAVTVTAPDRVAETRTLTVVAGASQRVEVTLTEAAPVVAPPTIDPPTTPIVEPPATSNVEPSATPRVEPVDSDSTLAYVLLGTGAAAAIAGGVTWGLALGTKSDAEKLFAGDAFDRKLDDFELQRGLTYGLVGVGGAMLLVGGGLLLFDRGADSGTVMGVSAGPAGLMGTLQGSF